MKKSEKLYLAMKSVVNDFMASAEDKLAVLEVLQHEKALAEWVEEQEEEKAKMEAAQAEVEG